ncbi:MAG: hypothetical protein L0332_32025 [Chloroflexi bacterium]|nr:hypothetical protein [Chloroflexota bacterium]MCI0577832.1 hypothetical protein [Chloroflexota bacterium]MCI0646129.1 hypothetical protein [Chloroflexota bacterium]MCI0731331.1 hypothetical protein [Chloroflexota bacterium]
MKHPTLKADMTAAEVLEKWPQTVPVFQHFRAACVGCALAPFDTLDDVARIYSLDLSLFLARLQEAVAEEAQV